MSQMILEQLQRWLFIALVPYFLLHSNLLDLTVNSFFTQPLSLSRCAPPEIADCLPGLASCWAGCSGWLPRETKKLSITKCAKNRKKKNQLSPNSSARAYLCPTFENTKVIGTIIWILWKTLSFAPSGPCLVFLPTMVPNSTVTILVRYDCASEVSHLPFFSLNNIKCSDISRLLISHVLIINSQFIHGVPVLCGYSFVLSASQIPCGLSRVNESSGTLRYCEKSTLIVFVPHDVPSAGNADEGLISFSAVLK